MDRLKRKPNNIFHPTVVDPMRAVEVEIAIELLKNVPSLPKLTSEELAMLKPAVARMMFDEKEKQRNLRLFKKLNYNFHAQLESNDFPINHVETNNNPGMLGGEGAEVIGRYGGRGVGVIGGQGDVSALEARALGESGAGGSTTSSTSSSNAQTGERKGQINKQTNREAILRVLHQHQLTSCQLPAPMFIGFQTDEIIDSTNFTVCDRQIPPLEKPDEYFLYQRNSNSQNERQPILSTPTGKLRFVGDLPFWRYVGLSFQDFMLGSNLDRVDVGNGKGRCKGGGKSGKGKVRNVLKWLIPVFLSNVDMVLGEIDDPCENNPKKFNTQDRSKNFYSWWVGSHYADKEFGAYCDGWKINWGITCSTQCKEEMDKEKKKMSCTNSYIHDPKGPHWRWLETACRKCCQPKQSSSVSALQFLDDQYQESGIRMEGGEGNGLNSGSVFAAGSVSGQAGSLVEKEGDKTGSTGGRTDGEGNDNDHANGITGKVHREERERHGEHGEHGAGEQGVETGHKEGDVDYDQAVLLLETSSNNPILKSFTEPIASNSVAKPVVDIPEFLSDVSLIDAEIDSSNDIDGSNDATGSFETPQEDKLVFVATTQVSTELQHLGLRKKVSKKKGGDEKHGLADVREGKQTGVGLGETSNVKGDKKVEGIVKQHVEKQAGLRGNL